MPSAVEQVHDDYDSGYVSGFAKSKGLLEYTGSIKLIELSWNIKSRKVEHAVLNGETLLDGGHFVVWNASTHYSFDVGSVLVLVDFGKGSDFFQNTVYFYSPEYLLGFVVLRGHFSKSVDKKLILKRIELKRNQMKLNEIKIKF